jgi:carboxyl-terminal processing protease
VINNLLRLSPRTIWLTLALAAALLCLQLPVARTDSTDQSATDEFERALDLIEQTQLELFVNATPASTDTVMQELERRIQSTDYPKRASTGTSRQVAIMRELLSETIDWYDDQYANYISPDQLVAYSERRSGSYVGVGLKFRSVTGDYPLVIGTLLGGPLEQQDIRPGDRLIAIDDIDLKAYSSRSITEKLKGSPDTLFELSLRRDEKIHKVTSKRRSVELHYARSETLDDKIGYIKISRFGGATHTRVRALLEELIAGGVTAVILDLRDNPGGSTRAARATVSLFSREPHVYCETYKTGEPRKLPRHGDHLTDLPLAVLVNNGSKSSAEIVAGALQGQQRAMIVGAPTFGKGLVQRVFNLAEPLGGALRTTIAMFGTEPQGLIQDRGIVPDRYVESDADFMFRETGSLNVAEDARAYQRYLLESQIKKKYQGSDKAEQLIAATDIQLQTAIEILKRDRPSPSGG